jgi:hypothetical protein
MFLPWNKLRVGQHTAEVTLQWEYYPSSLDEPGKTDHFACIQFLILWPIQLFWGFVHNSLVIKDSYLQLHERSSYCLLLKVFGSSQLAFEPWNWILNLLIKYWPFKCKNKCFLKCLLYFSRILLPHIYISNFNIFSTLVKKLKNKINKP